MNRHGIMVVILKSALHTPKDLELAPALRAHVDRLARAMITEISEKRALPVDDVVTVCDSSRNVESSLGLLLARAPCQRLRG